MSEFEPGAQLGGRYQVISILGKGGMGLVYRVKQIFLHKEFALKTIEKRYMSDIAVCRFQQEARTTFSVAHPNIISVHDFGVLDDQTPFLVMELVNGETLSERLQRDGCLTVDQATSIFAQICLGLAYAHQCGVIHRDIKPSNIMLLKGLPLGTEGSVKILDFGIAKYTAHEGGEIQALTRTGEIFGSPLYMSPEQCSGIQIDHRSDIYSLGCVLFEALTGSPPFMSDSALTTMLKHQSENPPTLKEASMGGNFSPAIQAVVTTMMAKSPERRYQNLGAVAIDLGALRRGAQISETARTVSSGPSENTSVISMSRRTFIFFVSTAVLSVLAAGLIGYWIHGLEKPSSSIPVGQTQAQTQTQTPTLERSIAHSEINNVDYDYHEEIQPKVLKEKLAQATDDKGFSCNHKKLTKDSLLLIADASWIHELFFKDCELENESLGLLAKLPHLSRIDVLFSNFDDVGAEKLVACKYLTRLVANTSAITDQGLSKLSALKSLASLSLVGCNITDAGLRGFARLENLVFLDLGRTRITNLGLAAVQHNRLNIMNVQSTKIDDGGMSYLSSMTSLQKINLSNTAVSVVGIETLLANESIRHVCLDQCPKLSQADINRLKLAHPNVLFETATDGHRKPNAIQWADGLEKVTDSYGGRAK